MKNFLTTLFFTLTLCAPCASAEPSWQKPAQPGSSANLQAIVPDPVQPGLYLVASQDGLFRGLEKGPWEKFQTPADLRGARKLFSFPNIPGTVFLVSESGVYACLVEERNCSRVFKTVGRNSPKPLTFSVDASNSSRWFVGTEKGLEESDDGGKTWFRFSYFRNDPVSVIASFEDKLVLAAGHLLFLSDDGAHFKPVFSGLFGQRKAEEELEEFFLEDGEIFSKPSFETLVQSQDRRLWIAGKKGVFESADEGKSWQALPSQGLGEAQVSSLVFSEKKSLLFAGTDRGVFAFDFKKNVWRENYAGLARNSIRSLALLSAENTETLAAVTPEGFFFQIIFPEHLSAETGFQPVRVSELFEKLIRLEPSSREAQKAAVDYANAKNSKIKRWHAGSRTAALLPSVSFGKDLSRGTSIDLDRRGTNEPDFYITGPEDVSRGWDFDVSWDLGDFIFSSNQTSIDSREKLMVELRNDILAEVTRIYFERRRLQSEAFFNSAASAQEHYDKILRIEELTALLDGLTGHAFSKQLAALYDQNPDLRQIWEYHEEAQK